MIDMAENGIALKLSKVFTRFPGKGSDEASKFLDQVYQVIVSDHPVQATPLPFLEDF